MCDSGGILKGEIRYTSHAHIKLCEPFNSQDLKINFLHKIIQCTLVAFFSLPIINLLLGNALLLYGDSLFWLFLRVKGLSRPHTQTTLIKAITKFFK